MAPEAAPGAEPLFPIRVVARLTGINPVTIRAWERRYGLVAPERTPGGHRLYSRADVERLRTACRLMARGLAISQASRMLDGRGVAAEPEPDRAVERFLDDAGRLDEESMTARYEALRVRSPDGGAAEALLAALPAALEARDELRCRVVEAWLSTLLGARLLARLPDEDTGRATVCTPAEGPGRTWGLVLALGLCGLGVRPLVIGPLPETALARAADGQALVMVAGAASRAPRGGGPVFSGPYASGGDARLPADPRAAARQVADGLVLAEPGR